MASTTDLPTEIMKRCDGDKVKVGDVYSRHSFGKVIDIQTQFDHHTRTHHKVATIQNANGDKWTIGMSVVELEFTIAGQFESEESLSRTALIELMKSFPRTAMTINFNKKVKTTDNADQILDLINTAIKTGKAPTKTVVRKLAADQQVGDERTMVGYHVASFDEHGRLKFQESDKGQRLVDPRTINWAIINRVKYIVK